MEDNLCTVLKLVFHKMQNFFLLNGHAVVNNPEKSDLMIIGTCAAFDADEMRSLKIVSKAKKFNKPIYAYGCMTRVNPKKLKLKNLFYSWNAKELAENIVKKPIVSWDSIDMPAEFRVKSDYRIYNPEKYFVGVSTGCAFDCSYCPHKLGVGDIVSRPINKILNQIKYLAKGKARKIVLTGTDVACYGKDIKTSFACLFEKILDASPHKIKFYVAQFNPQGIYFGFDKLVKCSQDNRVVDFQLPIQTSSSRLLKLMNRNYSINDVYKFISMVKEKNKNIMFRTDLMVGFPTETEKELNESINFAVKCFDEVAIYSFEFKKNTPIASYNLPLFSDSLIKKRLEYSKNKIKEKGILVHSGGQDIKSLHINDNIKEEIK